jgi:hypothetical protein
MTMHPMQHCAQSHRAEPQATVFGEMIVRVPADTKPTRRLVNEPSAAAVAPHASTIYLEINLDGHVHIYEMTEDELLLKVGIETRSSFLPSPKSIYQAHEYLQLNAYHLEIFETLAHAETWAAEYCGFRAGEVRAELRRYNARRATYLAIIRPAA